MSDDIRIKACPFCGGAAWLKVKSFDILNTEAYVECEQCGARSRAIREGKKFTAMAAMDKAKAAWNLREGVRK